MFRENCQVYTGYKLTIIAVPFSGMKEIGVTATELVTLKGKNQAKI